MGVFVVTRTIPSKVCVIESIRSCNSYFGGNLMKWLSGMMAALAALPLLNWQVKAGKSVRYLNIAILAVVLLNKCTGIKLKEILNEA